MKSAAKSGMLLIRKEMKNMPDLTNMDTMEIIEFFINIFEKIVALIMSLINGEEVDFSNIDLGGIFGA